MKILQLVQKPQLRGAEIFASQLSNRLWAAGHEVHMISFLPGDGELPFNGKLIRFDRPLSKRFIDIAGWRQLAHYIRAFNPDIVQANAGDTLKFAVLSKLLFRWKTPIVFRNANKVSDFINTWSKWIFNKLLMSQVRHVISVSELCRQDFIKTYTFISDKTTTVPIGIELNAINASMPPDLKPLFATSKVLVHAGSFVPEKNHLGLIRIVERLLEKGEDIKVLLLGDGKLRSAVERIIQEKKLSDRIFILGYRSDVLSIMANAQGFILPSKIEGLPGVILEAMYCRVPVVAYAVGGISEVVQQGETGWLVQEGDEESFADAIHVALHAVDIETIKQQAYELVVKEYDNRVIARRFLEVYESLVNRKDAKVAKKN